MIIFQPIRDLVLARRIKRLSRYIQKCLDLGWADAASLLWGEQADLLDQCSPRMQARLRGLLHP